MILSCQNINKAFGGSQILKNASFNLEEREHAAIVGINGAGKTTLLRIIAGVMEADSGKITLSRDASIGYLEQYQEPDSGLTIREELYSAKQDVIDLERELRALEKEMRFLKEDELSGAYKRYDRMNHEFELKNGYAYRSEITGVLKGLGFCEDDFDKRINTLSGGQKTRVSLGKILLSRPDLILLDEPTNHLDMESVAWLENFLMSYDKAVLVVAHDRYFLNRVASKIIEIDNGSLTVFKGNYSDYAEHKAQIRKARLTAWENQQREIRRQEEVITKLKSFNREKSVKRARSREKALEKMELLDRPVEIDDKMRIRLEPSVESGNDVLKVRSLSKSFGSLSLFTDLNFEIKRGERVALIGNNGTGKTTLLKIINRLVDPDEGGFTLGSKVKIGYYDQEHHVLHAEKTLFEEMSDTYPKLDNTTIRSTLAAFLFTGDDVFKKIETLSGGERGRVSLAKLMLSGANFLILDEPTNHLDIVSKEILEDALNSYTGTIFCVSHDRYFINSTATRILELEDGALTNYIGNYDYYLEKKSQSIPGGSSAPQAVARTTPQEMPDAAPSSKDDWLQRKEAQARKRKRENDLKKTEDEIFSLEEHDKAIDEEMTREYVYTDAVKCAALAKEKADIKARLEILYEKWEDLA